MGTYQFLDDDELAVLDKDQLPEALTVQQSVQDDKPEPYNPTITPVDEAGITARGEARTKKLVEMLNLVKPKPDLQTEKRLKQAAAFSSIGNALASFAPMTRKKNNIILKQEDNFTPGALDKYQKMLAEDKANEYQNALLKTRLAIDNINATDAEIQRKTDQYNKSTEDVGLINFKIAREDAKDKLKRDQEVSDKKDEYAQRDKELERNIEAGKYNRSHSGSSGTKAKEPKPQQAANDILSYQDVSAPTGERKISRSALKIMIEHAKKLKNEDGTPKYTSDQLNITSTTGKLSEKAAEIIPKLMEDTGVYWGEDGNMSTGKRVAAQPKATTKVVKKKKDWSKNEVSE